MKEKTISENTPTVLTVSIEGRTIELSFAESADTSIFDRLRQTLFQTYIQSLTYPINHRI